jgi:hypothetical protein
MAHPHKPLGTGKEQADRRDARGRPRRGKRKAKTFLKTQFSGISGNVLVAVFKNRSQNSCWFPCLDFAGEQRCISNGVQSPFKKFSEYSARGFQKPRAERLATVWRIKPPKCRCFILSADVLFRRSLCRPWAVLRFTFVLNCDKNRLQFLERRGFWVQTTNTQLSNINYTPLDRH